MARRQVYITPNGEIQEPLSIEEEIQDRFSFTTQRVIDGNVFTGFAEDAALPGGNTIGAGQLRRWVIRRLIIAQRAGEVTGIDYATSLMNSQFTDVDNAIANAESLMYSRKNMFTV